MVECRIHLVAATRRGVHPERLYGRFRDGELMFALTGDGRTWTRETKEPPCAFEDRIVRDLLEQQEACA